MDKDIEEFQKERNHATGFKQSLESQVPDTVDLPTSDDSDPESLLLENS